MRYLDAGAALPLALFWLRMEIIQRNKLSDKSHSGPLDDVALCCVVACHADAALFMQVAPFSFGLFNDVFSRSDCIFSARQEGLKSDFFQLLIVLTVCRELILVKNITVAALARCDTVVTKYSHFRYKCKVFYINKSC